MIASGNLQATTLFFSWEVSSNQRLNRLHAMTLFWHICEESKTALTHISAAKAPGIGASIRQTTSFWWHISRRSLESLSVFRSLLADWVCWLVIT